MRELAITGGKVKCPCYNGTAVTVRYTCRGEDPPYKASPCPFKDKVTAGAVTCSYVKGGRPWKSNRV